jgi:hypothetical protein
MRRFRLTPPLKKKRAVTEHIMIRETPKVLFHCLFCNARKNQMKLRVDFYGTGIFGRADKYEILNRTPIANGRQRTEREIAFN